MPKKDKKPKKTAEPIEEVEDETTPKKQKSKLGKKRPLEEVEATTSQAEAETSSVEKKKKKKKKSKKRHGTISDIVAPTVEKLEFNPADNASFADFELHDVILKGIAEMRWPKPTQVQESVIGLALEDKNLMVRARTGSGKTAAFVLPILHKLIYKAQASADQPPGPCAIFIAPTKELSAQIYRLITKFIEPLPYIRCLHLTEAKETEKAAWEHENSDMIVTTPAKLKFMLDMRADFCENVQFVVLDEADLLLSFGYESEMKFIRQHLPEIYQCIMTSATLSDDMSALKALFMTGPVLTVKLKEGDLPDDSQLTQYQIVVDNDETRFAILVAMFKLKLIVGKAIIFVKNPDRCYQMNLFLDGFKLRSGILNSAMPANSRCLVIEQFNQGMFPIIVASDAAHLYGSTDADADEPKKKKPKRIDKEAGVARGIDFHHVSTVINFDFPTTLEGYIHRVGRTARGFNKGTALSFCTPRERPYLDTIQDQVNQMMGREVLKPYEIRVRELDSFLLRARDVLSSCTKGVIREARLAEIRDEALRSAKLESYFAANPRERDVLASDKKLHTLKLTCPAIADVPDYIVPKALRGKDYNAHVKTKRKHKRIPECKKRAMRNQRDPLITFKLRDK